MNKKEFFWLFFLNSTMLVRLKLIYSPKEDAQFTTFEIFALTFNLTIPKKQIYL